MVRRAKPAPARCILRLLPDTAQDLALQAFTRAYTALSDFLDRIIPADQSIDLVALHRGWYEIARRESGLPSQTVTLALKDWAARRRGETTPGVAYDQKLYAARGIDQVALTTLDGRAQLRCFVAGYSADAQLTGPARLLHSDLGWELHIAIDETIAFSQEKERNMATDTVVTRIGRVIAGLAHTIADIAEEANPEAVLLQAIREIDAAIEEVRSEIGKAKAEEIRLSARLRALAEERAVLDARIKTALSQERDDLAEAGIARQLDIDAQATVLERLRNEVATEAGDLETSLEAIRGSRREAEARLDDLRRSLAASKGSDTMVSRGTVDKAQSRAERAMNAAARVSGVPNMPPLENPAALKDLEAMHRDHQIKERLAQLKAGRG